MNNPLQGENPRGSNSPLESYDDEDDVEIDIEAMEDLEKWLEGLGVDPKLSSPDEAPRRYPLGMNGLHKNTPPKDLRPKRLELFRKGSKFAPVTRAEIVGIDNVLLQVDEVIDWLINYKEYAKFKARPEPGIIFEGSPGTGKTYTSRYMATVSDARFIDVRDFPYSGKVLSAQDIKDLFEFARLTHAETQKPVIMFWDEFEGVATERSRNIPPEQKAVISQITAELDGVSGKPAGILLIGCTNYGNDIDSALRRPGRMGLHVEFNAPNRVGKSKLLELYVGKVRTKGTIDCETASYFFDDYDTAATVEEAVQQAWRFAVHRWINEGRPRRGPVLGQADLLEIFLKRLVGPPPAYSDVTPETLYRVAIHETGHALTAFLLGGGLRLVTVRPGKEHLGKAMTYLEDPRTTTLDELNNHLRVGVAGLIAERISGVTRGADAASDTKAVTEMALDMVDNEGAGTRVGLINPAAMRKRFYNSNPSISSRILEDADLDIQTIINTAERDTERLLTDFGVANIKKLAERLIEVQTMTGKDFKVEVAKLG